MKTVPKRWRILNDEGKGSLRERILAARGLNESDLNPKASDPRTIFEMDKAVALLGKAIKEKKRIGIYGDYDTDGITGTALLLRAFRRGGADCVALVPNRNDGYGLSIEAIRKLAAKGVQVVVTVDNGSDREDVVLEANRQGMEVIITDHHPINEKTVAHPAALINPRHPQSNYPFLDLCGAGVALALAVSLADPLEGKPYIPPVWDLTPLAALATVADVVPLLGANRKIVEFGLDSFTKMPGLRELVATARLSKVTARDLAFEIAPRLNAAGRMGDVADALQVLLTDNELEARVLAQKLHIVNEERKRLTDKFVTEAKEQVAMDYDEQLKAIVIDNEMWPSGIVGLIAAKLAETYCRPVYAGGRLKGDNFIHGSARSGAIRPTGVPVSCKSILEKGREFLISGGGHEAAAGFVVDPGAWNDFRLRVEAAAEEEVGDLALAKVILVDLESDLPDSQTIDSLMRLEPTGKGFLAPVLLTRGAEVVQVRVGAREQKLVLKQAGKIIEAVSNGLTPPLRGELIDLVYSVENDKYGGGRLRVEDWKLAL